ncbi:uncharacterized protein LOC132742678 [Ruditapes philippinarum]|uniref:uncharacterized protein LOC132742678 n=1 Tax=Ruditapes philippinarum TaxID=129788 RepID=UPI00295B6206|nr:uncharacterized protein LOC132742678 [Ruditapes philippinarum]
MSLTQDPVSHVLEKIGLRNLSENFKKQKVTTLTTCKQLSDTELSSLGLTTIGDRARFRAEVQTSGTAPPAAAPNSQGNSVSAERSFFPSRSFGNRSHRGRKEVQREKTWTAAIMCLSDTSQTSVPSHSEKVCLQKAGLGLKKIAFSASGSESDLHVSLLKEFPKLETSGGYELMYCTANRRQLKKIDVKWDVSHLKSVIGGQSRIYVRPIQNSLSLDIEEEEEDNTPTSTKYACQTCGIQFSVTELRQHIAQCQNINQTGIEDPNQQEANNTCQTCGISFRVSELGQHILQCQNINQTRIEDPNQQEANNTCQTCGISFRVSELGQHILQCQNINQTRIEDPNQQEANNTCQTCGISFRVSELGQHILQCQNINQTRIEDPNQQQVNNTVDDDILETNFFERPLNTDNGPETNEYQNLLETGFATQHSNIVEHLLSNTESLNENINDITKTCIEDIINFQISDPIHALKYIQSKIVIGRKLDIEEEDLLTSITGATNYIVVDRFNILSTGMQEIRDIQNLRLTLEVQFYGETAEDLGGPRKEFFDLILQEIQKKFFDPIRDWIDNKEYETIGKIFALSMLQNGRLPRLFSAEILEEFFGDRPRSTLIALGQGMDALGMFQILKTHQFMQHLMTPRDDLHLTLKMILHLMKPVFSSEGSNKRVVESTIFQKFIKYLREVESGRREGIHMGMVLKFVTGAEMEPPLGFGLAPSVHFQEHESFLPTANTCTNSLTLPIPVNNTIPDDEKLFNLYDLAFCNSYFGIA